MLPHMHCSSNNKSAHDGHKLFHPFGTVVEIFSLFWDSPCRNTLSTSTRFMYHPANIAKTNIILIVCFACLAECKWPARDSQPCVFFFHLRAWKRAAHPLSPAKPTTTTKQHKKIEKIQNNNIILFLQILRLERRSGPNICLLPSSLT